MPIAAKYLFVVSMDVAPEKEALFNEVYDKEHVPFISKVPGVRAVSRLKGEPFTSLIGGVRKDHPPASPVYTAIYEIDDPSVLTSEAWAAAAEKGRWPGEVRPFTRNRQHGVYRIL